MLIVMKYNQLKFKSASQGDKTSEQQPANADNRNTSMNMNINSIT